MKQECKKILQDLETFLNNIPEEYGGGEKEADINHGYQLCAKIVKAELRHFIDQRITKTDKQV